ncbi:MAG: indole-3-glycerol phosphate synthase [Opitutales bacterium]|nr:indole-3-glycerol phosphate synthase [Opitutales bacterium]|tara:strand:+ start:172 stop:966 length:795 start_codon:yes stop_codon:yes gene_type:complete
MDKLAEIMAHKREELSSRLRPVRDEEFISFGERRDSFHAFHDALASPDELSVISEIKRRSPSAGEIADIPSAEEQARLYLNAEVDALSVLTDEKFFGGSLQDLWSVSDFIRSHERATPSLRKDFAFHPIQVLEAAEAGASAVLLIARALDDEEMGELRRVADLAGLDCLYEAHDEGEVERILESNPLIVGVNNRNLSTFETDLAVTERLLPMIPDGVIKVSESGIVEPEDAWRARDAGADAVLCGEALMRAEDPEEFVAAMKEA